jgi:hypothetical protein
MGDQPVLWITVKSLLDTGPYSQANMRDWNRTVVDACAKYSTGLRWRKIVGISRTVLTIPRRAIGTAPFCPRTGWPIRSPPQERVRIVSYSSL